MTEDTAGVTSIPGIPTTILVAPDSFKGTFSAGEVAEAIGRGLQARGRPVDLCPVADGGEGTLDALLPAVEGELQTITVSDPLDRPIEASFALGERRRSRRDGGGERPGPGRPERARCGGRQHLRDGAADPGGDRARRRDRLPRRRWQRHHRRRRGRDPRHPGLRRPARREDRRVDRRAHAVRARRPGVRSPEGRRRANGLPLDKAPERPGPANEARPPRAFR